MLEPRSIVWLGARRGGCSSQLSPGPKQHREHQESATRGGGGAAVLDGGSFSIVGGLPLAGVGGCLLLSNKFQGQ